jgi:CBS domain-containing protein
MFVKEIMKKNIVTITSDSSVLEAAKNMAKYNIGSLVVVNDTLEGIITERDILNKLVARDKDAKAVKVREIMTKNVITISPDKDIEEACEVMARYKIKRLPVILGDEVVGIITSTDVVATLSAAIKEVYSQQ